MLGEEDFELDETAMDETTVGEDAAVDDLLSRFSEKEPTNESDGQDDAAAVPAGKQVAKAMGKAKGKGKSIIVDCMISHAGAVVEADVKQERFVRLNR